MPKELPYFRWYPTDAESDSQYTAMTLTELGLYHRCLNHAWTNDGLPSVIGDLARELRLPTRELLRSWDRVSRCFVLQSDGRLRNSRQESERENARNKSASASKSVRTRYERTYERTTSSDANVAPRALARAECVSVSAFDLIKENKTFLPDNSLFPDWWKMWSEVRGTHHATDALTAWQKFVPAELEGTVVECTASYLASLENPAKGFNPHTFLERQAKEHFESRWPAFANRNGKLRKPTLTEMLEKLE